MAAIRVLVLVPADTTAVFANLLARTPAADMMSRYHTGLYDITLN